MYVSLRDFIERLQTAIRQARRVALLCHSNADPDAMAALCTFTYMVKRLGVEDVSALVPEGIGLESRRIAELCRDLGVDVQVVRKGSKVDTGYDLCILIDVASLDQLKMLKPLVLEGCRYRVVIDHHEEHSVESELKLVDPEASSASELVFELAVELGVEVPRELIEALLAGIVFDTRRFLRVTPRTLRNVARMLEYGADYQRSLSLTSVPRPQHQRIARIKCMLRHRGFRARIASDDVFIALSEVGAYESDCANTLLSIGYDIAFVLSEDDVLRAVRVVYRAREDVITKLGIDIYSSILAKLVEKLGGGGGGHRAAGAAILRTRSCSDAGRELIRTLVEVFKDGFVELAEPRVAD